MLITGADEPFQGSSTITNLIPGLPKLNPGLELANTFGVMVRALPRYVI